jgi:predicted RNase H-like nuclease (RuvC/YqgF family)
VEGVGPWITLAALIIAAASLITNVMGLRQKTEQTYTEELERRVEDLEKRMRQCEGARESLAEKNLELARENTRLMRDLLGLKRNSK